MLTYEPVKVLLQIGPVKVFAWGLMVAIAFLAGSFLILREAEHKKFDKDRVANLIIICIIAALIGSRLGHIFIELPSYLKNPLAVLRIWEGGVTSYGGIIFAVLAAYLYLRSKKESFLKYADLIAPYIPLGFAIGRIGCFLNWDDFGIASSLPWAVQVGSDVARHPTQLYLFVMNLVIFTVLMKLKNKRFFAKTKGSVFFAYVMVYSALRLLIEPLRYYPAEAYLYAVFAVLGAAFLGSAVFLIIKKKKYKNK